MPPSQKERVLDLIGAVAPCWAGEALVIRRYFGTSHRTPARDIRWLGFQIFKEQSGGGVYGGPGATVTSILRSATERAAAITLATPASEVDGILDALSFAVDELRHMAGFMRLYALAGGDPDASIESLGQLEHAPRLAALRHELRATHTGRLAVDLSEGGGLGLQFGLREHFQAHPPASALDRELAPLSQSVLEDETQHLLGRFAATPALGNDDRAWSELGHQLVAICAQKLRERNEQFSSPIGDAELAGIAADRSLGQAYIDRHLAFLVSGL